MKAIAVIPGTPQLRLVDRPEPSLEQPDEIKLCVLRVGICGTDREEAGGGCARAPDGQKELVIGHEMFGQVTEVGRAVTRVKPGDFAVFSVRRGCGKCLRCLMNRSDMCLDYRMGAATPAGRAPRREIVCTCPGEVRHSDEGYLGVFLPITYQISQAA